MNISLSPVVGEQKSKTAKRAGFYILLLMGLFLLFFVVLGILTVVDTFTFSRLPFTKRGPLDQGKVSAWGLITPFFLFIIWQVVRIYDKYTRQQRLLTELVERMGGNPSVLPVATEVEHVLNMDPPKGHEQATGEELERLNLIRQQQNQQTNREFSELDQWHREQLRRQQETIAALQAQINAMMGSTGSSTIGYKQPDSQPMGKNRQFYGGQKPTFKSR